MCIPRVCPFFPPSPARAHSVQAKREQIGQLRKKYDKSEDDLKALQVCS